MNRRLLLAVGGVLLAVASGVPVSGNFNHTTFLTFNTPIGLPGVTLPAGTYVFERVNTETMLDVVQVRSRDRSKVYMTGITRGTMRPDNLGNRQIVFAEVKAGQAPRIAAWYPMDSGRGHEFIY